MVKFELEAVIVQMDLMATHMPPLYHARNGHDNTTDTGWNIYQSTSCSFISVALIFNRDFILHCHAVSTSSYYVPGGVNALSDMDSFSRISHPLTWYQILISTAPTVSPSNYSLCHIQHVRLSLPCCMESTTQWHLHISITCARSISWRKWLDFCAWITLASDIPGVHNPIPQLKTFP